MMTMVEVLIKAVTDDAGVVDGDAAVEDDSCADDDDNDVDVDDDAVSIHEALSWILRVKWWNWP